MRPYLIIIFTVLTVVSCKKAVEKVQENIILDLMTNGQWTVTRYLEGDDDLTVDFAPYSFQFYKNGTVSGFWSGPEEKGTWVAMVESRSIKADFPQAGLPLQKLNADWKITDSSMDEVKAKTTVDNIQKTLWLKKK